MRNTFRSHLIYEKVNEVVCLLDQTYKIQPIRYTSNGVRIVSLIRIYILILSYADVSTVTFFGRKQENI